MELDKAALDRWLTTEPKWREFDDADDDIVEEGYRAEEEEGPDPDLAYDQWREARIWGT